MIRRTVKRIATVAAALTLASATVLAVTAVPASAAGVPNYYYCSVLTGKCQQQNKHSNDVGNMCHHVPNAYTWGQLQSICNWWDN